MMLAVGTSVGIDDGAAGEPKIISTPVVQLR
jgi:hypothetical protein